MKTTMPTAESLLLSDRAESHLLSAHEKSDYQEFAAALHGFKEAQLLWRDNPAAMAGLPKAILAYATCADAKEDFDLAASLLDEKNATHRPLLANVNRKRADRNMRQKRLRTMKTLAIGLVALVVAIGALAFVMIRNDRNRAIAAHETAVEKMQEAEVAKSMEAKQRLAAVSNQKKAEQSQLAAERAARKAAESAAEAKRQEAKAARESYLAQIGLVAARAEENAFREANRTLDLLATSPFRHWEWGRLKHVCSGAAKKLDADGRVEAVSVDENFQRIAVGSRSGKATVWSLAESRLLFDLPHSRHWVHDVAFSPDGTLLATACSDGQLRLFDATTGQMMASTMAHRDSVLSVSFSPDGRGLVTSSYDKTIGIWDVAEPQDVTQIQRLRGHSWWVHEAVYSPDGLHIVSAGHDGKVIVWKRSSDEPNATFEERAQFAGHDGPVYAVAFSPDSKHIATGGHDKRVMVWDYSRQDTTSIRDRLDGIVATPPVFRALDGHRAAIRSVSFSSDGKRVVTGSVDNTLKIWDTSNGQLHRTLRGHEREVRAAMFSPDDQSVISGGFDETVRIWKIGGYRESRMLGTETVDGHSDAVMDARFSATGDYIVTASRDRTARIWDHQAGKVFRELSEGHDYLASAANVFSRWQAASNGRWRQYCSHMGHPDRD